MTAGSVLPVAGRLRAHQLAVGYPGRRGQARTILDEIDAALSAGELTCLVGPNGSGKSTLLRSLAGLQPPLRGEVSLEGRPMRSLNRREVAATLAVVLTDRFDPGRLRAAEIVAMGRHPRSGWAGRLGETDRKVIDRCLALVGADALGQAEFSQLSDGQRQRVMVARALAQEPRVLLLDEPTAFLDPPGRLSLMMLLHQVAAQQDMAILVCTHDIELASRYADRLWVADRCGALVTGTPEDLAYSGRLAESFAEEGVVFDLASLAFVAERPDAPPATVHGQGPEAHLAGHALRRSGFQVVAAPQPGGPSVHAAPGRWTVTVGAQTTVHDSLSGLAHHARELRRDPAASTAGTGDQTTGSLRVGILHLAPTMGEPEANREELLAAVQKAAAAGAQLIVAPELAVSGYGFDSPAAAALAAEPLTGPTVTALADLSRQHGVYCAVGLLERDERTGLLYNTGVATSPEGKVVARHRKLAVAERRWATPGTPGSGLFTTPWGQVGLLVCADSYWGTPARAHALRGADLLLVLANWPPVGLDPRQVWRARALDNGVPVVACNRTGSEPVLDFQRGRSFAVDGRGEVLLDEASERAATFLVDLPLAGGRVRQHRASALAGRKPESWGGLGLDVSGSGDRSWLWGTPPEQPVQLRLTIPEHTIHFGPGNAAWVTIDGLGPLLSTTSGAEDPLFPATGVVERLDDQAALVRVVAGCRVAVTTVDQLRHPETSAALARRGCDLIAVPSSSDLDEPTWAMLAARCLERVPIAVVTRGCASVFVPPEGCEGWTEHSRSTPGTLTVNLDVAAGRRRHLLDRLDLETLCGPSVGGRS